MKEVEYERVKGFKYIGTILTDDHHLTVEITQGICMANKTSYGFQKQLQYRT